MNIWKKASRQLWYSAVGLTTHAFGGVVLITSLGLRLLVSSKISLGLAKVHRWIRP